jgi:hypothetical protein
MLRRIGGLCPTWSIRSSVAAVETGLLFERGVLQFTFCAETIPSSPMCRHTGLAVTVAIRTLFSKLHSPPMRAGREWQSPGQGEMITMTAEWTGTSDLTYSLSVTGGLTLDGRPNSFPFANDRGLSVQGSVHDVHFLCDDHPLVVTASAYWLGPESKHGSNQFSQVSDSCYHRPASPTMSTPWHNRVVPARGTDSVSIIVR